MGMGTHGHAWTQGGHAWAWARMDTGGHAWTWARMDTGGHAWAWARMDTGGHVWARLRVYLEIKMFLSIRSEIVALVNERFDLQRSFRKFFADPFQQSNIEP